MSVVLTLARNQDRSWGILATLDLLLRPALAVYSLLGQFHFL